MQQKNSLSAFTLMELLVGIALISIMALGASQLNFSRLSKNQELSIGAIKIVNIFEEIRNNSLLGRGVGVNLETPTSWKIEISQSGSGQIHSFYTLDGSSWLSYPSGKWQSKFPFSLENIQCSNLDNSSLGSLNGTGTLSFTGGLIAFSGTNCNNPRYKLVSFDYNFGNLSKTIQINTLSGVIEIE